MKRLKYILASFVLFFIVTQFVVIYFRLPSYTIKTSGKLYIVSKITEDILVFDLFTGKEIAEIPIHIMSHESVATSDEKKIVLTDYEAKEGNTMKVIDVATNKVEKTIHLNQNIRVNGIVALPDANKVGVIDYVNDQLLIVNIKKDRIEKQLQTEQQKSHLIVLHPHQPIAYVTNVNPGSVSVIDLNLNTVIKIIYCGLGRKGIAITPDGSELWVTNTKENLITVINTATYEVIKTLSTDDDPLKLKFTTNGKYCLVTNASSGTISVYNQKSKQRIKTIILNGKKTLLQRILYHTPRPVNIVMHPNGKYAFVSNSNANKIEVIDLNTFSVVSTIGTGKLPDGLIFVH